MEIESTSETKKSWSFRIIELSDYKYTKHKFIHLLVATFKDLHIENSKNYKSWYCLHHTDCVSIRFHSFSPSPFPFPSFSPSTFIFPTPFPLSFFFFHFSFRVHVHASNIWSAISTQRCKIDAWSLWPPIWSWPLGVEWSRDRWRHVTPKGQTRDPIIFEAPYLCNGAR